MQYPKGVKNKEQHNDIIYANRGMDLEFLINNANEYYLEKETAIIYKKPTPIGLVDVDYKKGEIKKAYFKDKSTFDYNGIYRQKYIDFEAKESHIKTSFPLNNIHPHQITHLRRILKAGGICFLIVYINLEYYILKGDDLVSFIDTNERKSIPYQYFKDKCYKINLGLRPYLDYLSVIDKIYF